MRKNENDRITSKMNFVRVLDKMQYKKQGFYLNSVVLQTFIILIFLKRLGFIFF